jgi:hypothetical protein
MGHHQLEWEDLPEQLRALSPDEKALLEAICLWSITYTKPVHKVVDALNHIRTGLKVLDVQIQHEQEPSYVADRLLQEFTQPY